MIRGVMLLLAVLTLTLGGPAWAADLDGTLKKIKDTNTIRLGYREASRPFSFTGDDGKPAGYSVDLCTAVAASIAKQLALPNLQTTWVKVTVANRMEEIVKGAIDLECGSTTASLSRQEQVDFSLLTFLDGGSLLVTDAGGVKDVATLGNKRVAVIPGTTTEKALSETLRKRTVSAQIVPVKDHDEGRDALLAGKVDGYVSDRVLLIGLLLTSKEPAKLVLADEQFSYEPYGLMMRRGDASFRLLVNRTLAGLYRSDEMVRIYETWFGGIGRPSNVLVMMYVLNALPE